MGGREEARRRSCDRLLASLEDCRRKHHHMADVCRFDMCSWHVVMHPVHGMPELSSRFAVEV